MKSTRRGHLLHVILAWLTGSIESRLSPSDSSVLPLCRQQIKSLLLIRLELLLLDQRFLLYMTNTILSRSISQRLHCLNSWVMGVALKHGDDWRIPWVLLLQLNFTVTLHVPLPCICVSVFNLERRATCDPWRLPVTKCIVFALFQPGTMIEWGNYW